MPTISTTTPPQKNTVKAVQLKALEERQKAQELAMAKATQYQQIESPWQGAANMLNSFFTARKGSALQAQEDAARNELAKIRAGFGPEGPTMAQIQQVGQYDQDAADKMQADLLQRNFTRSEREAGQVFTAAQQEDTQQQQTSERIAGQDFTRGENESQQAFELRKQKARNDFEVQQAADKVKTDAAAADAAVLANRDAANLDNAAKAEAARAAAAETAKRDQAKIDADKASADLIAKAKLAEPGTGGAKVYQQYLRGQYGDPKDPETTKRMQADWEKETNIPGPTEQTVTLANPDGTTSTITTSSGGRGTGGTSSGGTGKGKVAPLSFESLAAGDKAAVDMKTQATNLQKALINPGYTGPGGDLFGTAVQGIADTASGLVDTGLGIFGIDTGGGAQHFVREHVSGDPASRLVIAQAGTKALLDNVSSVPGAISNKEGAQLTKLGANLNNRPDANKVVADLMSRVGENIQKHNEMAKAYYLEKGTFDRFEETVWEPFIDAHPSMDYDENTDRLVVLPLNEAAPPTQAPTPPATGGGKTYRFDAQGNPIP